MKEREHSKIDDRKNTFPLLLPSRMYHVFMTRQFKGPARNNSKIFDGCKNCPIDVTRSGGGNGFLDRVDWPNHVMDKSEHTHVQYFAQQSPPSLSHS